ncbi:unnamed protein product [Rotaria magnacalcarata]|uniref:Uncharacterized protein n=3 Tax=Rotaria magnacalcarata TaxID=392030 RepID=A0A8S2RBP7_9BILA|nr:unnamed protein product [Rotaria magnacalcarata]
MVWLLANITKFIFMTTKETCFTILMSVRDIDECTDYFLNIKDDLYKLFVGFWTQHRRFMTSCDQVTRSRVFVVNGHQKANRLVCQYKDVFDSTTSELGLVYCQHHQPSKLISNLNTTTSAYKTDQENKETALDKLALIEYVGKGGHYSDKLCKIFRSGINNKQKSVPMDF